MSIILTAPEHKLIDKLGSCYNDFCEVAGQAPETRRADLTEIVAHIHALQHWVMANAAARCYPDKYRTMGGVVHR